MNAPKLAYNSVAAWLDGKGPMPPGIGTVKGLDENLRLQDRVAQKLRRSGIYTAHWISKPSKARPVFEPEMSFKDLEADTKNRAQGY